LGKLLQQITNLNLGRTLRELGLPGRLNLHIAHFPIKGNISWVLFLEILDRYQALHFKRLA